MTTYNAPPNVTGLVLNIGDILNVYSGGTSTGAMINGGTEYVDGGGTDIGATINNGGTQEVTDLSTSTSATINSGGLLDVDTGSTATSATINSGGLLYVEGGGTGATANGAISITAAPNTCTRVGPTLARRSITAACKKTTARPPAR